MDFSLDSHHGERSNTSTASCGTFLCRGVWLVRVVEGSNGNNQVDQDTQGALKVIGFSIAQEVAHNKDCQD